MIVTLGERGALLVDDGPVAVVPAPKVQAVDTTGAGDAFVGSFAFFLARGHDARRRDGARSACRVDQRATPWRPTVVSSR